MSRVGKKPVKIPEGVTVNIDGRRVKTSGPQGEIELALPPSIEAGLQEGKVLLKRKQNSRQARAMHGTANRQIRNMLKGVSEGWSKTLELVGTGYRARLEQDSLVLQVGFSHPVRIEAVPGIKFSIEENKIAVLGPDKVLVGQVAANIRKIRPPEPYKGKGIKYEDEVIRRKAGKSAKTGPAAA